MVDSRSDGPQYSRSDRPKFFKIPTMADLLVMSYEENLGNLIDRETSFHYALCKELAENGTSDDLLRLLTGVNRRVAVRLQKNESDNEKHTMPNIMSTLTKNLHFIPKAIRLCTSQQDGDSQSALKPAVGSECTSKQDAESLSAYYDMIHEQRGTEKDQERLEKTFRKLGFDVKTYNDRTTNEIKEILQKADDLDHQENDCIVVIVLSHGGEISQLEARDGTYAVDELWKPILDSPSLFGKPKLFFIQACCGEKTDPGFTVISKDPKGDDIDSVSAGFSSQYFKVPTKADLLVMYATYQGHFAFRNPDTGSVFIQTLCDEFDANGVKDDLFYLLTGVNRRVWLSVRIKLTI
ncbi:hypothetical protein HA402_011176 [Bradysia odoriphaga]|nr:hypothetical protein HA402_011176 [Bradysia odoriphaga]